MAKLIIDLMPNTSSWSMLEQTDWEFLIEIPIVPNTGLYSSPSLSLPFCLCLALDVLAAGILEFQLFLEYAGMLSHHMIV